MLEIVFSLDERRRRNRAVWIERRWERRVTDNPNAHGTDNTFTYDEDFARYECLIKSLLFACLMGIIVLLNVADYYFTYISITLGAKEANPIMGSLINMGWEYAAAFKFGIIAVSCAFFWRFRHLNLTLWAALAAVAIYGTLFVYHYLMVGMFI